MRGVLLAMTVVVAACGDHGIAVVVTSSVPNVAAVRLYVGTGDSQTATLTNATKVPEPSARYWTRDPKNESDLHKGFVDKTTFYFDTDIGAPVVIAVGYDGQGNPIAGGEHVGLLPATDDNTFAVTTIDLAAVGAFTAQASSPVELSVWSTFGSTASVENAECAGIVTDDGPIFIVRDKDQDCDGNIDGQVGECAPNTYLGEAPSTTDGLCLAAATTAMYQCQIGGKPCVDANATTMSPASTCLATNTCLPVGACTLCAGDYNCALGLGTQVVNSYTCTIPIANGQICGGSSVVLPRPPTGGYDCAGHGAKPQLADMGTPAGDDTLKVGTLTIAASFANNESCGGLLAFSGAESDVAPITGLVTFPLVNNGSVALPIQFNFNLTPTCASVLSNCTLDTSAFDDSAQTQCVSGWNAPPIAFGGQPSFSTDPDPTFNDDANLMFYVDGSGSIGKLTKNGNTWTASASPVFITTAGFKYEAPELSGDGQYIVVTSIATIDGTTKLAISHDSNANFTTLVPIVPSAEALSYTFHSATFEPDDTNLIVSATANTNTLSGLYDVKVSGNAIVSITPIVLGDPATTSLDHPHLSMDGLQLYYDASPMSGASTVIHVASRKSLMDTFTTSTALREVAPVSGFGAEPWVNSAATLIYFTGGPSQAVSKGLFSTTRADLP